MKRFCDYLQQNERFKEETFVWDPQQSNWKCHSIEARLFNGHIFFCVDNTEFFFPVFNATNSYIQDFLMEIYGIEVRFCDECGKLIRCGFTEDDGWWYACEDCFEVGMNRRYGEGNWWATGHPHEPYYEWREPNGEVEGLDIYYTEWF